MATNLNLDSLNVDNSGRVSFSGLGSGIDIQGAVDGIMAAKQIPVDRIEQRISDNEARIAILDNITSLTNNLLEAADTLRGAVSFDGSSDIFEAKGSFTSSSRTDAQSPSVAGEILSVSATNRAETGQHTIEVEQIAAAHKIASGSISGTTTDALSLSGTFDINGASITLDTADSLLDLRDKINAVNAGDNATGVTASIISLSASEQVLTLTADETGTDAAITVVDNGADTVLQSLGVIDGIGAISNELKAAANARIRVDDLDQIGGIDVIERQTNTIDDVFDGVTLSLFKAEAGTTITLDVERDLNQVKSAIVDLVDAYNEVRTYLNTQAQSELIDEDGETITNPLAGTRVLSDIRGQLSAAISSSAQADDPTFATLAQIGINFQGADQVGNPLLANTLSIDETKLDDALLNQSDAVRDLFAFDLSSSSSDVILVGFDENTSYSENGYKLNVAYANGEIVSANIDGNADGSDDGSVSVDGQRLTVNTGGAEGLSLLYTGTAAASGIQLDVSVGVGTQIHNAASRLLDSNTGVISGETDVLSDKNTLGQSRIDTMSERLERERERLLVRFANMEAALASMNTLLDSIRTQMESAFGGS